MYFSHLYVLDLWCANKRISEVLFYLIYLQTKTVKVVKRVQDLPLPAAGLLNIFLRQEVLGVLFVCLLARRFHTKFHSSITWIVCAVQVLYVIALKPGVVRTKELMLASSQASSVVR